MHLKIAIVVHGRFYAFDLVRELVEQGHDVTLFTNYPAGIVERFGIPKSCVRSFILHGIISRVAHRLKSFGQFLNSEPFIHSWFSKWASRKLIEEDYDVIQIFSGVAEESFHALASKKSLKILVRGSAHIRVQASLLEEEGRRSGLAIDKPSDWMTNREEREYQLADYIVVLSTFAQNSFINQGIAPSKLKLLPLGAQLAQFRPEPAVIEERCQRILSGQPLRVLMVSTFSLQKGVVDLVQIASNADPDFEFRFVGAISDDAATLVENAKHFIQFTPKQPQFDLPKVYTWGDIFIFTTIQDGYAVVLSQAQAAGLAILSTENCAAPDILRAGESGWIFSIRDPDAFIEQLKWCHRHRQELAQMVRQVYATFQPRDWADVAQDFAAMCSKLLTETNGKEHGRPVRVD